MILSFLYPFNIRNNKAPHLWFFYYQLEKLDDSNVIYIGTQDYFDEYSEDKSRGEHGNKLFKIPTKERIKKINKYIISNNIFSGLDVNYPNLSNIQKWKKLIEEVYLPLELELENIRFYNI